jgi:HEAT repeat protein
MLARLETIDVALLRFPKDVPVIGMETLLERCRKASKSKEADVRGHALSGLAHHCAGSGEALPDLLKALEEEKHEYPLRCAASALARLGPAAKPAIPAMRAQLKSADKNVKQCFEQAIEIIEKEKSGKISDEETKKRATIRRDISEFLKSRGDKKSP